MPRFLIIVLITHLFGFCRTNLNDRECERLHHFSFYDPESKICRSQLGSWCTRAEEVDSNPRPPCPQYSTCEFYNDKPGETSYCRCLPGYVRTDRLKYCIPKKLPGDSCQVTADIYGDLADPCFTFRNIKCRDNSTCSCPTGSAWNGKQGECNIPVGGACKDSYARPGCGRFGTCAFGHPQRYCQCANNGRIKSMKQNGFCFALEGNWCQWDEDCLDGFTCENEICIKK